MKKTAALIIVLLSSTHASAQLNPTLGVGATLVGDLRLAGVTVETSFSYSYAYAGLGAGIFFHNSKVIAEPPGGTRGKDFVPHRSFVTGNFGAIVLTDWWLGLWGSRVTGIGSQSESDVTYVWDSTSYSVGPELRYQFSKFFILGLAYNSNLGARAAIFVKL